MFKDKLSKCISTDVNNYELVENMLYFISRTVGVIPVIGSKEFDKISLLTTLASNAYSKKFYLKECVSMDIPDELDVIRVNDYVTLLEYDNDKTGVYNVLVDNAITDKDFVDIYTLTRNNYNIFITDSSNISMEFLMKFVRSLISNKICWSIQNALNQMYATDFSIVVGKLPDGKCIIKSIDCFVSIYNGEVVTPIIQYDVESNSYVVCNRLHVPIYNKLIGNLKNGDKDKFTEWYKSEFSIFN